MTDPADAEQLRQAVHLQGAAIGRQEILLQEVMGSLVQAMSDRHDQVLNRLIEQIQALTVGPDPVSPPVDPSPPAHPTAPASREPRLPPPERYDDDPGTCRSFLSQCSLIFELQPSTFPTERARIAYLVTLMSGKARAWATAIWEQQSSICHCYEDFTA